MSDADERRRRGDVGRPASTLVVTRSRSRIALCAALASGLLLVVACGPGPTGATGTSPHEGMWRAESIRVYLVIDGNDATFYEYTSISCAGFPTGTAQGIPETVFVEEGRLRVENGQRVIFFDPVQALPERCSGEYFRDDPEWVFAVLAATVEEHYPRLAERDPDWVERREALAAGVDAGTSPADLLAVVLDLLGGLEDTQVRFATGDPELLPGEPWSAAPENPVVDRLAADMEAGVRLQRRDETASSPGIVTGRLPGGAGYLGFGLLAVPGEGAAETERMVVGAADGLLADLEEEGAPGLVIDLRATDGGVESIALLIASRFVPEQVVVGSQELRVAGTDRFVDAGTFTVSPHSTGTYDRPVVVLTGPGTAGAAEWLVLALRHAPNVTAVGEATFGSQSPLLVRVLPNRWNLGLPNGIVTDAGGRVWELIGIPPAEVVPLEMADLEAGVDPVLERALEVIGG